LKSRIFLADDEYDYCSIFKIGLQDASICAYMQ